MLEKFLTWILDGLANLAGFLPDWDPALGEGVAWVLALIEPINYYLPVSEVLLVVAGFFLLAPAMAAASLTLWLAGAVTGRNSRG